MPETTYRIGPLSLEPDRQLLKEGTPVAIGRKQLALLSVLARAEGGLVTKDELMSAVWPNAIVEENAIQAQIAGLRKVLGTEAARLSTARGSGIGWRRATGRAKAPASGRRRPSRLARPSRARRVAS